MMLVLLVFHIGVHVHAFTELPLVSCSGPRYDRPDELRSLLAPVVPGFEQLSCGFLYGFLDAVSKEEAHADEELGIGIVLLGGHLQVFEGPLPAFRDVFVYGEKQAVDELRIGVSLVCRQSDPLLAFFLGPLHALSLHVEHSEDELRFRIALDGRFPVPFTASSNDSSACFPDSRLEARIFQAIGSLFSLWGSARSLFTSGLLAGSFFCMREQHRRPSLLCFSVRSGVVEHPCRPLPRSSLGSI